MEPGPPFQHFAAGISFGSGLSLGEIELIAVLLEIEKRMRTVHYSLAFLQLSLDIYVQYFLGLRFQFYCIPIPSWNF